MRWVPGHVRAASPVVGTTKPRQVRPSVALPIATLIMAGWLGIQLLLAGCAHSSAHGGGTPAGSGASATSIASAGRSSQVQPERLAGASLRLDGSPGVPLVNLKTSTLYVPILCGTPSPLSACSKTARHAVDLINIAQCNVQSASNCRVVARAMAGKSPFDAALDERTDTLYVVNQFAASVSVISGATCNAMVLRGCGRPLATVKVGKFPQGIAFNPATRSVYVANTAGNSVSVINAASCNAATTLGCDQPVKTVKDGLAPAAVAVDVATDTVYVVNGQHTVSVIDGATCNGYIAAGCSQTPPLITAGFEPYWAAVDEATNTIYVPNNEVDTVSVINGATCNATHISGCGQRPTSVGTGPAPSFVAIDPELHTLFVANQNDDTISEINIAACNAKAKVDCPALAKSEQAVQNPPAGFSADAFALAPDTGTIYLVDAGGVDFLVVTSIGHCNASDTSGCSM